MRDLHAERMAKTLPKLSEIIGRPTGCNDGGHWSQDFVWYADDNGAHCTCCVCGRRWHELQDKREDDEVRLGENMTNYTWSTVDKTIFEKRRESIA